MVTNKILIKCYLIINHSYILLHNYVAILLFSDIILMSPKIKVWKNSHILVAVESVRLCLNHFPMTDSKTKQLP